MTCARQQLVPHVRGYHLDITLAAQGSTLRKLLFALFQAWGKRGRKGQFQGPKASTPKDQGASASTALGLAFT
eukprot:3297097-Amphidinium_carterae.1